YLAGYAIECAIKACIAKQTKRHDFPDKEIANKCYVHKLEPLIVLAGKSVELDIESKIDPAFAVHWTVVKNWSEQSRYELHAEKKARDMVLAVSDKKHGVLRWLKQHW